MRASQGCKGLLRLANLLPETERADFRFVMVRFGGLNQSGLLLGFLLEACTHAFTLRMFGTDARDEVLGLQRFNLRAHGIFAAAGSDIVQIGNQLIRGKLARSHRFRSAE